MEKESLFYKEVKKACFSADHQRDAFILMDNLFDIHAELVDNFSLFEYMQNDEKFKDRSFYLINKDSVQFETIQRRYGDKIIPFSFEKFPKKLIEVLPKIKFWLDSFQVINLLGVRDVIFSSEIISVYTQHGINFFKPGYLGNCWIGNCTFKKIIFSSEKERELFKKYYTYNDKDTIIAGLSRWDDMSDCVDKSILFYFTGRAYLNDKINVEETEYFKNIQDILCSESLAKISKEKNIKIYAAIHHTVRNLFNKKNEHIHFLDDVEIGKIKKTASMLVTDFSSMCFDFMCKDRPVIFFRIDANSKFLNLSESDRTNNVNVETKNSELYNIFYSAQNVLDKVKTYVDKDFKLEEEYKGINCSFFGVRANFKQTILDCLESSHQSVFDINSFKKSNGYFKELPLTLKCFFSKDLPFNVSGLSIRELKGRWTDGKDVYFNLKIPTNSPIRMEFKFRPYETVDLVRVWGNNEIIAEWKFGSKKETSKEILLNKIPLDGDLQLHFEIFNYKNINGRELGLFFEEFKLEAVNIHIKSRRRRMRIENVFLKKIAYKLKSVFSKNEVNRAKYLRIKNNLKKGRGERINICGIQVCQSVSIGGIKSFSVLGIPFVTYQRSDFKDVLFLFGLEVFKRKRNFILEESLNSANDKYKDELTALRKKVRLAYQSKKNIYIDITNLAKHDAGTGIQRVTRNILFNLLKNAPENYEVLPVYLHNGEHRVAYSYLQKKGFSVSAVDHKVLFLSGDILILPELFWTAYEKYIVSGGMRKIRDDGVKVFVVLHDLLPVRYPQYVANHHIDYFEKYLGEISKLDGVITVSKFVANDYRNWLAENNIKIKDDYIVDWFHLGSDIDISSQTSGIPAEADAVWKSMSLRPTLLQVSTVEPRKGYAQALGAFEKLWDAGIDVNFIIVGREGWKVDELKRNLRKHKELGRRLFWLQGISDEYLDAIYARTDGVLFASEAEGFGLAVIEGAQHGKPLILRDIPVFREIAGENATYFSGTDDQALANCIEKWLINYKNGNVISSEGIKPLTWEQSAQMLISKLPL